MFPVSIIFALFSPFSKTFCVPLDIFSKKTYHKAPELEFCRSFLGNDTYSTFFVFHTHSQFKAELLHWPGWKLWLYISPQTRLAQKWWIKVMSWTLCACITSSLYQNGEMNFIMKNFITRSPRTELPETLPRNSDHPARQFLFMRFFKKNFYYCEANVPLHINIKIFFTWKNFCIVLYWHK